MKEKLWTKKYLFSLMFVFGVNMGYTFRIYHCGSPCICHGIGGSDCIQDRKNTGLRSRISGINQRFFLFFDKEKNSLQTSYAVVI